MANFNFHHITFPHTCSKLWEKETPNQGLFTDLGEMLSYIWRASVGNFCLVKAMREEIFIQS